MCCNETKVKDKIKGRIGIELNSRERRGEDRRGETIFYVKKVSAL